MQSRFGHRAISDKASSFDLLSCYPERQKVEVLMSSSRFPIPQGTLDMLILQILSLEPAHGYGIAQRLEQKAWLKGHWKQSETGREAKFYSLTRAGQTQLRVEKASWARLMGAVQLIFDEGIGQ
jgi:PadR family transcriptional regulator